MVIARGSKRFAAKLNRQNSTHKFKIGTSPSPSLHTRRPIVISPMVVEESFSFVL